MLKRKFLLFILLFVVICFSIYLIYKLVDSFNTELSKECVVPYERAINTVMAVGSNVDEEKDQLEARLSMLSVLENENAELRRHLKLVNNHPRAVSADVISRGGDGWWNIVRIGKGSSSGIRVGDTVVSTECKHIALNDAHTTNGAKGKLPDMALVGRVVDVTANSADVLLLTDANSKVACKLDKSSKEIRGILSGGGIKSVKHELDMLYVVEKFYLGYMRKDASPMIGSMVISSGLGGVYPAGIPVGVVTKVVESSSKLYLSAEVIPYIDFASILRVVVLTRLSESAEGVDKQ